MAILWTARREGWAAQSEDARDDWDIDYARVIHSASFRRLQGKTQILEAGESDFYRTRLTHSLEVGQIAAGLVRQLRKHAGADELLQVWLPDRALIQAIGFTHDLGHPPFGHGGEVALNYCLRDEGGFEGNGQTLRLLTRLEDFSKAAGANLTRRTLLGVLKYPVSYSAARAPALQPRLLAGPSSLKVLDHAASHPPKCYLDSEADIVDWLLEGVPPDEQIEFRRAEAREDKHAKPLHKSFDCSLMDLADDIAYGIHDLEDAIALGLLTREDFALLVPEEACGSFLAALKEKYPAETGNHVYEGLVSSLFGPANTRKRFISRLVHHALTAVAVRREPGFSTPLLMFRAYLPDGPARLLNALKKAVAEKVIRRPAVQQLEFKGQQMILSVFEALASAPARLMPSEVAHNCEADGTRRPLCDYIASMTDRQLLLMYERLFSPRMGSAFDRL
jgi:dGTPase